MGNAVPWKDEVGKVRRPVVRLDVVVSEGRENRAVRKPWGEGSKELGVVVTVRTRWIDDITRVEHQVDISLEEPLRDLRRHAPFKRLTGCRVTDDRETEDTLAAIPRSSKRRDVCQRPIVREDLVPIDGAGFQTCESHNVLLY